MALDAEVDSLSRPTNLGLILNPFPSKNFLSLGRGQLGAVGGGSQGLFCDGYLLASSMAQDSEAGTMNL